MKLKTFNDLMVYGSGFAFKKSKKFPYPMVREVDIKSETIKWVTKDVKDTPSRNKDAWAIIFRWMRRLNITEDDLK